MQITAYTEAFNLKHNTIVLGISSYYPQKYMSGTPLKCQKRWGFRGLRPLTPTKGLCPLDPRRGHRPRTPPQIKMKWRPWACLQLQYLCVKKEEKKKDFKKQKDGGKKNILNISLLYSYFGYFLFSKIYILLVNKKNVHGPGIEPGPPAWQARILPLNHPCFHIWISNFSVDII